MTDIASNDAQKKTTAWVPWMHVAGIGYAAAIFFLVTGPTLGGDPAYPMIGLGAFLLLVATVAFIGGWGRLLATKK